MTTSKHIRPMEVLEIVLMQAFNALVIGIWFHSFGIFRCLHAFTRKESVILLLALIVCSIALDTIVEISKMLNGKPTGFVDSYIGAASGFGIYLLLSYYSVMKTAVLSTIIIALVGCTIYSSLLFLRKIRNKHNVKTVLLRRLNRSIQGSKTIVISILTIVAITMGILNLFGFGILRPAAASVAKIDNTDSWTIANNIETLALLRENEWVLLSPQEKLNVLQVVANNEANYLGLHELTVVASNLHENTLADYNDNEHLITLDINHLYYGSPSDVLDSVLHESRHGYQYRLIELYLSTDRSLQSLRLFNETEVYISEFADYADGEDEDTWVEYYTQQCERDAREYAAQGVQEYYARINEYYASNNHES